MPGWAQVPAAAAAARASSSNEASAASGELSACAGTGKAASRPTAVTSRQAKVRASITSPRDSAQGCGGSDFDNVHLGECIRSIEIYRAALLAAEDAPCHQAELFARDVDQYRHRDPQRQT